MNKGKPVEIAAELDKYEPGYLPEPLFVSIARLVVLPAVEFIPLRKVKDKVVQVLLFERSIDDPIWSGMLHTPGTVLRPSDNTLKDAFERLFKDELGIDNYINPVFVKTDLIKYKRGSGITIEYIIPLDQEPRNGRFYSVDNLPPSLIPEQKLMIKHAAEKFLSL